MKKEHESFVSCYSHVDKLELMIEYWALGKFLWITVDGEYFKSDLNYANLN